MGLGKRLSKEWCIGLLDAFLPILWDPSDFGDILSNDGEMMRIHVVKVKAVVLFINNVLPVSTVFTS